MPRAKKTAAPARPARPRSSTSPTASRPATRQRPATEDKPEPSRSEEVQIILPAADEPVRRGGWVLTDNGWQPEDGTAVDGDQADDEKE